MGKYGMTEYYKGKLEAGLEYQDFISDQLRKSEPCIIIGAYSSKKYQYEHGESSSGIEIKHDMMMKATGNLYIEVAEKSNANLPDFTESGIMRNDNTWLYLIGDYEQAFLFSKKQLRIIYEDKQYYKQRGIQEKQKDTSIGFILPIGYAKKFLCLYHFVFDKK